MTASTLTYVKHLVMFWQARSLSLSFLNYLFKFWLHSVFIAMHGLFLVVVSRGYSLVAVLRLLIAVASIVADTDLGSRAQ